MTLRLAVLVTSCLWSSVVVAQTAPPELTRQQRDLLQALVTAVDRAPSAPPTVDEHAWLTHVLRTSNGSHYVAFSITPRTSPLPAGPLVVYVRLATAAKQGTTTIAERSVVQEWLRGSRVDPRLLPQRRGVAIGDMPALGAVVERDGRSSVGSSDLQAMALERQRSQERRDEEERRRRATLEGVTGGQTDVLQFEDFEVGPAAAFGDGTRAVQRALTAGPGTYDLSVAWVDATHPAAKANVHVARRSLRLGPAASEFGLSSVIVADRIGVRPTPYSSLEQRAHPYAIGATEIVPARDTTFTPNDQLSVAFQIVNPMPTPSGKPDVAVSLRIVRLTGVREEQVAALSPLTYNATTLPADFDGRLGHPLIAAMSAPLATIPRGQYRLVITAEDRAAGTTVGGGADFTVVGTAATLLAEAPALSPRPDHRSAVEPATVRALLDRIAPPQPSPALARALDTAHAGRYADLLVATPVPADEEGVRAALTGLALLSIGDQNAGTQFQRALLLGAPAAPVQFLLGVVRAMQNRDVDAISSWQAARNAGLPPAIVDRHIAGAYLRRGETQTAAAAIAVAEDPASARIWAATRIATRHEAEAVTVLDTLLARDPDDAEARWLLVHALYSEFVNGGRQRQERLAAEAQRYIDGKGPHAALASEWLKVVTSS